MKSLSVIFILFIALMLITKGEVYFGFVVLLFTFFTAIKSAASSPYGDFSKTAEEINAIVQSRKKGDVDIDYLSYPEQLAMKEQQRQQGIRDRARERAKRKSEAKRVRRVYYTDSNTDDLCDDNLIFSVSPEGAFSNNDDYFVDSTITNDAAIEETYINPSTGMIMICGIGGIDAGGHFWGESDSFDNSITDCFSSLDDANDCFTNTMDEW
jgi:hypothetical protein